MDVQLHPKENDGRDFLSMGKFQKMPWRARINLSYYKYWLVITQI